MGEEDSAIRTEVSLKQVLDFVLSKEQEIILLLRDGQNEISLSEASRLSCADVTYILAYMAKEQLVGLREAFSLDGRGKGLTEADGHLVLGLRIDQGLVYIDGTIWQIDPDAEHIKVEGPFASEDILLTALEQAYGGEWKKTTIPENLITEEGAERSKQLVRFRARQRLW